MQAGSQVSWIISSILSGRQTSLQAQIAEEMEDSQRLLHISAGTGYHKERAGEWYAARFQVWGWQWKGVWG